MIPDFRTTRQCSRLRRRERKSKIRKDRKETEIAEEGKFNRGGAENAEVR
jgi:hypothetical protein